MTKRFGFTLLGLLVLLSACGADRSRLGSLDGSVGGAGGTFGGVCSSPLVSCGNACVDPSSDEANCGGCGQDCDPGAVCTSGNCNCPPNTTDCGNGCTTGLQTDPLNCGTCGNNCDATGSCVSGQCTCPPPLVADGGNCRDVSRDPNHCGAIDNQCQDTEYCVAAQCVCRPGLTATQGGGCVDLQSDPSNCGTLGNQCGNVCADGVCVDACPNATQECDNACVNTETDVRHCGDCGQNCDREQLCIGGNCEDFRPASGCISCPCVSCGQRDCCNYPGTTDPICVNGASCP